MGRKLQPIKFGDFKANFSSPRRDFFVPSKVPSKVPSYLLVEGTKLTLVEGTKVPSKVYIPPKVYYCILKFKQINKTECVVVLMIFY